jgi:hypothetical protein
MTDRPSPSPKTALRGAGRRIAVCTVLALSILATLMFVTPLSRALGGPPLDRMAFDAVYRTMFGESSPLRELPPAP